MSVVGRHSITSVEFPARFVGRRSCRSISHDFQPLLNQLVERRTESDGRVRLSAEGLHNTSVGDTAAATAKSSVVADDAVPAVTPNVIVPLSDIQKLLPFGTRLLVVYSRKGVCNVDGNQYDCVAYRLRNDDEVMQLVDCYRMLTGQLELVHARNRSCPGEIRRSQSMTSATDLNMEKLERLAAAYRLINTSGPVSTNVLASSSMIRSLPSRRHESTQPYPARPCHEFSEALEDFRAELCHTMEVSDEFLNKLSSARVITNAHLTRIKSVGSNNSQRADTLIDILTRRPDDAFPDFLKALWETGQAHIASFLRTHGQKSQHGGHNGNVIFMKTPRDAVLASTASSSSKEATALANCVSGGSDGASADVLPDAGGLGTGEDTYSHSQSDKRFDCKSREQRAASRKSSNRTGGAVEETADVQERQETDSNRSEDTGQVIQQQETNSGTTARIRRLFGWCCCC